MTPSAGSAGIAPRPCGKRYAYNIVRLIALTFALPPAAHADTLVDHLDGITLDAEGHAQHFSGIVIGNDGRIVQVLQRGDKAPRADYAVDGKGAVALPGMIDAHLHLFELGFAALTLDLTGAKSLAEAQGRIAAYAAAHPDRPWIIGRGWDQESWATPGEPGRFPSAADLDAVVADRPVWLERVDGHAGWANSLALAAAHINAATRDPVGGRILRVALTQRPGQKPEGVLIANAAALVERAVPPPRPEDRDLALRTAQDILLRHGVTACADMGTSIEDWQALRRAGDAGGLSVRVMAYALGVDNMALIAGSGPTPWLYDDRLRLGGVDFIADGALGSRGALLKAPYTDEPATHGLSRVSDTQLRNLMSRAAIDHFQVAVDAIGDAANAEVLSAIDELALTYKGDRRWRIEQARIVDPIDIPRFGQNGIVASMQPAQETSDWRMAAARLGPSGINRGRLAGADAWRSIAATGAHLAFGSDAPVEAPDPFAGIAAAITRADARGEPAGGWQPQEAISREAALAAYTMGAAYAGFAEGHFGRIAVGQRADFILVDHDPLLATPGEIRATKVSQTWVGGRLVFKAPDASGPLREMRTTSEDGR